MTLERARTWWALWLGFSVSAAAGCSGPGQVAGRSSTATPESTLRAESFVCASDELGSDDPRGGESPAAESEASTIAREPGRQAARPASRADGWSDAGPPSSSPSDVDGEAVERGVPALFQSQSANLGALACALDAGDCESAGRLGEQICRLAARICDLDDTDARCAEARGRCSLATARVRLSCPTDRPPQSPVTP